VAAAQWNQTEADWRRILLLAGPDAVGIEVDGRIAASASLLRYPPGTAWLGMVLTLPKYRGQGMAKALLRTLLARTSANESVYLDATVQGQPIYESLGFEPEGIVQRWLGELPGLPQAATNVPVEFALDREVFGADRSSLLRNMPDAEAYSLPGGSFGFLRPGRQFRYWGPLVAVNVESARHITQFALRGKGQVFWDIAESNPSAVALAQQLGFTPQRRLVRMVKGPRRQRNTALEYGIAGFEYG
jgi:RimJ/RimL family protein N-acetyltransferase